MAMNMCVELLENNICSKLGGIPNSTYTLIVGFKVRTSLQLHLNNKFYTS